MKVVVFLRKKRKEANSIEEIFYSLKKYLGNDIDFIELPYSGANIMSIFRNIFFAYRHRGDVNHISGEVHYIALGLGRKTLLTIHDVQSIIRGNKIERIIKKWLWFKLPLLIVRKVSVISHSTEKEVISLIPKAKSKTSVVYNPVTIQYTPLTSLEQFRNRKCKNILHIGTKPNKNLEGVLKAVNGLQIELTIVGRMSESQTQLAQELNINYKNYHNLLYTEILKFYSDSDVVTFPSFYEGFGMPIIEANAIGVPIVASNIPVLHEVANDAAYFVNPNSIPSIREAILLLLEDNTLREKLIELGKENIKRFAPQTIAEQYKVLYNQLDRSV